MKQIPALLLCLSLLICHTACTPANHEAVAGDIAQFYTKMTNGRLDAEVLANFSDRVQDFTLRYTYRQVGNSEIEILAPEDIAGITATIQAGQSALVFDGVVLETGPLPGTGLTPVDLLPALMAAWQNGHMSALGEDVTEESNAFHLTYRSTVEGVAIEKHTWFKKQTYKPIKAEVLADGLCVLSAVFIAVEFEE